MNIIEKWIEELEYGEYKQARSRLKAGEATYCCLGVLCEISGMGTWEKEWDHAGEQYLGEFSIVPPAVKEKAGLTTSIGDFLATDEWYEGLSERARQEIRRVYTQYEIPGRTSLVALNDARVPFSVIAEVVRSRPPGLFGE